MAQRARSKLLVVGAGLTGSLLWRQLRVLGLNVDVEIWDKGRGVGGRASTATTRDDAMTQADLGLQYISTLRPEHAVYTELIDAKILTPMTARIAGHNPKYMDPAFTHFVAAKGTASLCEYLLREADVVRRTVTAVDRESVPSDAEGWCVTAADGSTHSFDAVVLTVPVPQVLQLGGVAEAAMTRGGDLHDRLCAVEYSARWAMAVSLEPKAWDAVHGLGWGARYISKEESSSICYIAADQVKRGSEPTAAVGPTLVVHSGVPWSLKNGAATPQADEADGLRSRIQMDLVDEVKRLLPDVVGAHAITWCKLHKWRFSQVYKGLVSGTGAEVLTDAPLLVLAGDGCTNTSGFDSCLDAANAAAAHIPELARL